MGAYEDGAFGAVEGCLPSVCHRRTSDRRRRSRIQHPAQLRLADQDPRRAPRLRHRVGIRRWGRKFGIGVCFVLSQTPQKLRSISIVVASRQSNPFCSNLPASYAGDNRNRPHCGKRYTLETVVGLRIKTCISIFQYYATDSSLSETLFAEVHYQS